MLSKLSTARKIIEHKLISNGWYAKKADKDFIILMYHGVDKVQDTRFNQRFYSRHNFEQQIAAFKKHFNILTYEDLVKGNMSSKRTNVLLTFDDGYANNYTYALPLLDQYNMHALYFVTGVGSLAQKVLWADAVDIVASYMKDNAQVKLNGITFDLHKGAFANKQLNMPLKTYIKASDRSGYAEKEQLITQLLAIYDFTKSGELNDYWQLMTDQEINRASQSKNITIGSHGFYHNNLGSLSTADAVSEVMQSKQYLEGIIQKEVTTIGFPDGSYTEELNDALYKKGITHQFLVEYKYDDAGKRPYTYDRVGLYPMMGNNNELLYKILRS
ncbi:MAG: polysaccharide deacetylase family protein [Bacteroidota bacterium]